MTEISSLSTSNRTLPAFDQHGVYSIQIGNQLVTALSDGTVAMQMDKLLGNISPGSLQTVLSDNFLNNDLKSSINTFLLETESKLILIDTGAGDLMGAESGHLLKNLQVAGYRLEDIDYVLLTHIHGDHSGGLVLNNEVCFPNAMVHVHQAEIDYWLDESRMHLVKPERQQSFKNAVAKVKPYQLGGQLSTFTESVSLFRGLSTLPSPGHTPGHTHYVFENNGEKLIFCGDIAHVPLIQFTKPDVSILFDVDPDQAASSRRAALLAAAQERYWLAAAHASFPGIGHVRKNGEQYSWHPINYSIDGTSQ
jgi:glyoxylase-like metal-dependent hydrolase (beta-lactamase superfamily II)